MDTPHRSTKWKVAFGYLLLTVLLFASVGYIYTKMQDLTERNPAETTLIRRRQVTNHIVSQLYRAEVIGQSLSTGRLDEYRRYKEAMQEAGVAVDSLRTFLTDSLQQARLDTVVLLLQDKSRNMRNLLRAIQDSGTDRLYKAHIDSLLAEQDSLLNLSYVRRKVVTHTNSYTIHKKPKGFFKRLGEVFAPGKGDSTQVSNVIQEEFTDTLTEAYSPADTVATLLKDIQARVTDTHQTHIATLNRRTQSLRLNGLKLGQKVNQLLSTIEEEEQHLAESRLVQEESIRRSSVRTVAGIAILAVILAVCFLTLIWRDITRSNHYRRELERAKRRAEDLLVARERLMLTITHDIKAPAGSIVGYIDLLERITTDERQSFYLGNMRSSAQHLLRLVHSLLDYHRLDARKMDITPVPFNPAQLFEAIRASFQPMADAKGLSLTYECSAALDRNYRSDPFRIRQVAENLLTNALKFTEKGSVGLKVALENGQLHISVSDTGCGISHEEQQRIFQEFTRLRNAQGQEGFGLGLAITRKLVRLLQGEIHIESERGRGSTFHVFLPLEEETENTAFTPVPVEKPDTPLQLLLIDDDSIQLQLTAAMLEGTDVQITCCGQPEELFSQLAENHFDALLTDLQMPALNGFELLKAVRALHTPQAGTISVIALTARSDMDEAYLHTQGFAACLHKPFTTQELLSVVGKVTGKKFDFSTLTAFSADDPEAAKEILCTFISETQKNLEGMQQALAGRNMPDIAALAHKLLPLFTMLGATKCLPDLVALEQKRETTELTEEDERRTRSVLREMEVILKEARKQV